MTVPDTDDDLTEMSDMTAARVDAVKGAANGATWLLVKALAEPEAADEMADAVAKAEQSAKEQDDLPDSDFAYIEDGGTKDASGRTVPRSKRHFPVNDAAHVRNALARADQSPFGDKAMPKIKAAAKKFGVEAADGAVAKAEGDDAPGSAAWETKDSAMLHNAAQMLARVNTMLEESQDREEAELDAGAEDDLADICDLDQAMSCLDQALAIVSRLVYTEGAEALTADSVAKAGRRLSAKSEQALKDTMATLTALLAGDSKSSTPKDNTTEGAAGTDKEDDMNEEQLAKALKDNNAELATAITAGLGDLIKSIAAAPTVAAEAPVAKAADDTDTSAAPDPTEALVKGLAAALKEAVTPLEERMAKMEASPRRGVGPLATVPRGGASSGDLVAEVKDLLAKAEAEHDPAKANRHREKASMLSLTVGARSGRLYGTQVPYDLPSTD